MLKSDQHQNVIIERDIVRIEPVDPNAMALPAYEPGALVDAVIAGDATLVLNAATGGGAARTPQARRRMRPRPV